MDRQQRIIAAREIVTKYLHGEIDPERNPEIFDDDIVYFAVARLDHHDIDWLLAQLANPQWPQKIRAEIAAMMPGHRTEAQAALEV
ncbi:hypothetical protein OIE68_19925 [Nocardia vinacea]|uniref:hypothetical protein n=1 Tax=Nocardia vinacea TaxID=96468 RepID=UPI002E0F4378|nr:hypothetical protein OIE68_19925 [Nocardia vinacea]